MGGKIEREFILEGLDCAGCAAKIEDRVKKLAGVRQANLNLLHKSLIIEFEKEEDIEGIVAQTRKIVSDLEPHVLVKEKIISKPSKKILILTGLHCAGCANKIEEQVQKLPGVEQASLNFVAKKLTIEAKFKGDLAAIIEKTKQIVKDLEPDVEVIDEKDTNQLKEEKKDNKLELLRLGVGTIFFALALAFNFPEQLELGLYLISYFLVGGEVLWKAGRNILRGQVFDENFLMAIATIGAFAIKQYPEGVAVMLFYQIGEYMQGLAVNRSRKSIAELMNIRPDSANLKVDGEIKEVAPEEVLVGDLIIVKPGEKVPLDGKIIEGTSLVDTSALTGESMPREVEAGSEVLSGFINKTGLLTVEVAKEFGESTVARILDLVQNASNKKAPTENFITKFARYYTPGVVVGALAVALIPPLVIPGATFAQWFYRALVFLVISCPCALVVSIPLGFFGGIGAASRNGILIKGGNYLEALNTVDTVVFDKTGTLTKGVFKVTQLNPVDGKSKEELLEYAALAESYSNHPIAVSILQAYGKEVNQKEIDSYTEMAGQGVKIKAQGKEILAGNLKLMIKEKIVLPQGETGGTAIYLAVDGQYFGSLVIADQLKEDSLQAIRDLKKIGIKKIVMLTGDSAQVGEQVGRQLAIDQVYAELLPEQKVEKLELLVEQKETKGKVVFVGDGINDAPVLARADIGIAMGALGSDAAIEAADVVLMTDQPSKIVSAIKIAKRTRNIVWQNIIFSLGVKGVVLLLGAGGLATLWEAVFADVGVALIAVLNAIRVMNMKDQIT